MINVAILTGGPSAEREIALNSADLVARHLDDTQYASRKILLNPEGWIDEETGIAIDLNDFSLPLANGKIKMDVVFLVVHGTPVEDGKLQGYFEAKGIPYTTCDTLTCALTFNKQWCKDFLLQHGVPMAESRLVKSEKIHSVDPSEFEYPVFVKPNNNGSSYGISKVMAADNLPAALVKAAEYDTEVMIEAFMQGREFSSGAVREGDQLHLFPLTEIIPDGEFFDYDAKYLGAGQEITPPDLSEDLVRACHRQSRELYELLNCRGMVRFDYILWRDRFHLLEVNTVPGLSEASIIPQQARAYGWTIGHLLDVVVAEAMST